jgi:putative transposase
MPRMARVVIPGYPHHVTQRGNQGQRTFFGAADYRAYLDLILELKDRFGVEIWAYCLMPNHIHMVAVPEDVRSLAKLFGLAHHRYARRANLARNVTGHLWQARFHSFVMDENHLLAAVRYVELNPVRAGLCARPEQWRWSSARAHIYKNADSLLNREAMHDRVADWRQYLSEENSSAQLNSLRRHSVTGRPAGGRSFIDMLEKMTGQRLARSKPGPKSETRELG